ncbi:MAG: CocE/NonD family hydrolase [Planctomycetota bacterium]
MIQRRKLNCFLPGAIAGLMLCCFSATLSAQDNNVETLAYKKQEVRIPMRDGVTLHTTIYSPARAGKFPVLLSRTPYGCNPYGVELREPVMYNRYLVDSGYIFVYQDLRSRAMSDGDPVFENLRPAYSKLADATPNTTDEITDAEDTINWLIKNFPQHNGRVGMFGSSYMGFTSLMGAASGHPNLKAVLAAAPSIDIYFEDFTRNGMFTLAYAPILDWFGTPKQGRHEGPWWKNNLSYWADGKRFGLAKDRYDFFLKLGPINNLDKLIPESNYFWKLIKQHPNYDSYREMHDASQYLSDIQCPVLLVGGWNDEQNLFGPLKASKAIQELSPAADCRLLMGPWAHSEHKQAKADCRVGDIWFGDQLVDQYHRQIEFAFFESQLKDRGEWNLPKHQSFDTGSKQWISSDADQIEKRRTGWLMLTKNESLEIKTEPEDSSSPPPKSNSNQRSAELFIYVSDPRKPVPFFEDDNFQLFPAKAGMTGDQRFASKRPDVLTFISPPLDSELSMRGPLQAKLIFSTDQSDADLIVKLIDVLPMDRSPEPNDVAGVKMNGYQQLVRFGQIRGRFRESYAKPIPFQSDVATEVNVELLDVCHTFGKGHRVMIQIQSTMFPLFDRNPQTYVDNIFFANEQDFVRAIHSIHVGSKIQFQFHE